MIREHRLFSVLEVLNKIEFVLNIIFMRSMEMRFADMPYGYDFHFQFYVFRWYVPHMIQWLDSRSNGSCSYEYVKTTINRNIVYKKPVI